MDVVKARARALKYYYKHVAKIRLKRAHNLQNHGKEIRAKDRARYRKNRDRQLATCKRWRERNKEKVNLFSRTRAKKLRKATPKWVDMKSIEKIIKI